MVVPFVAPAFIAFNAFIFAVAPFKGAYSLCAVIDFVCKALFNVFSSTANVALTNVDFF